MYADLLKQKYAEYGFTIDANNLRIIPINVDYPTPMGSRNDYLDPAGPKYSEIKTGSKKGQLLMEVRDELGGWVDFNGSNLAMRTTDTNKQFQPGYTPFNINWDNLSSEDQDIADALVTQTEDQNVSTESTPQNATIETPAPQRPSFIAADAFINDYTQNDGVTPQAPPIIPNGIKPVLPSWSNLTGAQKKILDELYGIGDFEAYNELLNDPATAEGVAQDLGCAQVM